MKKKELLKIINKVVRDKTETLDLSEKNITKLPPEIGQLTNLTRLYLHSNQLTSLPPEIGQLTNLTTLSLSINQLTSLPPEIGQLTNLTGLHLNSNQLTSLPPEIGQLTNLTTLYLHSNQLASLPPEIGQLANLSVFTLFNNQLTSLPPEIGQLTNLTELYLSSNQLTSLPAETQNLRQLKHFYIENNNLPIPPEIAAKTDDPQAIINYYFEHEAGAKRPLNEAKMVLVGQGSVGKTSLVNRLIDNCFDPDEKKTEGIEIRPWKIVVNREDVQLNVWDFGGQEIMHATHQFFLTKRSLYLLVLDCRLAEEENRIEYWLKIIQSFGGDSPIIIVGNKCDVQAMDINKSGLQAKYPQIKTILETSCKEPVGIEELKEIITQQVDALEHVHDQLLNTWLEVKRILEDYTEDYISYERYELICRDNGITNEQSKKTLIGFLNDLGVLLNFRDNPLLEDMNILNPEWVTNGVYRILNNREIFLNKGVLERTKLKNVLDQNKYPENKHLFIVGMMQKFELCFDFPGYPNEKFLIPDLLPKDEPFTGEWTDALNFQYHYDVLPGSVVSRFIVRMHAHIFKNTYWRTGVVLENDGNKAQVKADIADNKIYVKVIGPEQTRRGCLSMIRAEFAEIHKTIAKIKAEQRVPLPDNPDITVGYEHLLNLENLREETYVPEGAAKKYSVKDLLEGIETERTGQSISKEGGGHERGMPKVVDPTVMKLINKKAHEYARRWFIFFASVLAVVFIGLAISTIKYGWDTMEPYTYFIAGGAVVASYVFLAFKGKSLSPPDIHNHLVEARRKKDIRELGRSRADN